MKPARALSAVPDVIDAQVYGSSIRALIRISGKTQAELAEAVGMDQPKISKVISGARGLKLIEAHRIVTALGAPIAVLDLGEDEITRRALVGVVSAVSEPDGGPDLPGQSSPWSPNVASLDARRTSRPQMAAPEVAAA